jgi:hypothetical protein
MDGYIQTTLKGYSYEGEGLGAVRGGAGRPTIHAGGGRPMIHASGGRPMIHAFGGRPMIHAFGGRAFGGRAFGGRFFGGRPFGVRGNRAARLRGLYFRRHLLLNGTSPDGGGAGGGSGSGGGGSSDNGDTGDQSSDSGLTLQQLEQEIQQLEKELQEEGGAFTSAKPGVSAGQADNDMSGWGDFRERFPARMDRAREFLDRQVPAVQFGGNQVWWNPKERRFERGRHGEGVRPVLPEQFNPFGRDFGRRQAFQRR